MSESDQRQTLIRLLRPLNAVSVENLCGKGTPDLNYGGSVMQGDVKLQLEGWIECKWAREWPVRGGPLRVEHYTQDQKIWARKRRHKGGTCWLILTVGRDWILLDGSVAALSLGHSTREELIEVAKAHWDTTPERDELICKLIRP